MNMNMNMGVDEGGSSQLMRNSSLPSTPTTPGTPATPPSARKVDNVWRSVFNPGSNSATKTIGAHVFDKPLPNTPTVYDWYVLRYEPLDLFRIFYLRLKLIVLCCM